MDGIVSVRDWLRTNGVSGKRDIARYMRAIRRGDVDVGASQILGKMWVVQRDTPLPVLPEPARVVGVARTDGRVRWTVYCTDTERADMMAACTTAQWLDVRERARKRRERKRALADATSKPAPSRNDVLNEHETFARNVSNGGV